MAGKYCSMRAISSVREQTLGVQVRTSVRTKITYVEKMLKKYRGEK